MPSNKEDNNNPNNKKRSFCDRYLGKDSTLVKYEKAISIFLLIGGMIAAIAAAYIGASEQAKIAYNYDISKSKIREQNVAKLLYIDIQRLKYSLNKTVAGFNTETPTTLYVLDDSGRLVPDNGIYYTYQNEIASFKYPIAKNITQFYTDIYRAESANSAIPRYWENNRELALELHNQCRILIWDADRLVPIIEKELEEEYNISPDSSLTIYG